MFALLMGLKTISPEAKKMGYTNVRVMSAGISGWLATKLPTEAASHD